MQPLYSPQARTADRRTAIRPCRDDEAGAIVTVINGVAEAYRGRIPADCWHESYMSVDQLHSEIEAGIAFMGCEVDAKLVGVMGIQPKSNVDLIRHAYVLPAFQARGIGHSLIAGLLERGSRQFLVATWAAATWAVGFYERHGFRLAPGDAKAELLRTYWTVSERQIETSVVLASPHLIAEQALLLIQAADQQRIGLGLGARHRIPDGDPCESIRRRLAATSIGMHRLDISSLNRRHVFPAPARVIRKRCARSLRTSNGLWRVCWIGMSVALETE